MLSLGCVSFQTFPICLHVHVPIKMCSFPFAKWVFLLCNIKGSHQTCYFTTFFLPLTVYRRDFSLSLYVDWLHSPSLLLSVALHNGVTFLLMVVPNFSLLKTAGMHISYTCFLKLLWKHISGVDTKKWNLCVQGACLYRVQIEAGRLPSKTASLPVYTPWVACEVCPCQPWTLSVFVLPIWWGENGYFCYCWLLVRLCLFMYPGQSGFPLYELSEPIVCPSFYCSLFVCLLF